MSALATFRTGLGAPPRAPDQPAAVPLDLRGAARLLAIGLPFALAALLLLPSPLKQVISPSVRQDASMAGFAAAPLILVLMAAVWMAYRPFHRATRANPLRTKLMNTPGFTGKAAIYLTVLAPFFWPLIADGRLWFTLALTAGYLILFAVQLENERRELRPAAEVDLRWSDPRLEHRRFIAGWPMIVSLALWVALPACLVDGPWTWAGASFVLWFVLAGTAVFTYWPFLLTWVFEETDPGNWGWKVAGMLSGISLLAGQSVDSRFGDPMLTAVVVVVTFTVFMVLAEGLRQCAFRLRVDQLVAEGFEAEVVETYGARSTAHRRSHLLLREAPAPAVALAVRRAKAGPPPVQFVTAHGHLRSAKRLMWPLTVAMLVPLLLPLAFDGVTGLMAYGIGSLLAFVGASCLVVAVRQARTKGLAVEPHALILHSGTDQEQRFDRRTAVLGVERRGRNVVAVISDGRSAPVPIPAVAAPARTGKHPPRILMRDPQNSWGWNATTSTWNGELKTLVVLVESAESLEPIPAQDPRAAAA